MTAKNKNLLFISPNASASGAPKLLLNLAEILQEISGCKIDFIFSTGGLLIDSFKKIGQVKVINKSSNTFIGKVLKRILNQKNKINGINFNQYDTIIFNTISNGDLMPTVRSKFKGKIITYVHELKVVTNYVTSKENLDNVIKYTDIFFVPSNVIKNHLIENCNIEESIIKIIPSYIPYDSNSHIKNDHSGFVVGGCGTVELRKGTDIFIQVASYLKTRYPELDIIFLWKGANIGSLEYQFFQEDISKLGLKDCCTFLPVTTSMESFYSTIDIFLLSSREDPYPLVVLEAANAAVPTICFDNAGGAVDFVMGNGKTADYLNVKQVVDIIIYYYENPEQKKTDGTLAKQKLHNLHQDKDQICASIIKWI